MAGEPLLRVVFFSTEAGREPVRDWLRELSAEDRKVIGEDVKLLQFRWPLGMPLVRKLEAELWEVRSNLTAGKTARVLFSVEGGDIALLHGFIKKTQKTPETDLEIARSRCRLWKRR